MTKNELIEIGTDTGERAAALVAKAGDAVAELAPVAAVVARNAEARGARAASRASLRFVVPAVVLLLTALVGSVAWRNRDRILRAAGDALTAVKRAVDRGPADERDVETAGTWQAAATQPSDNWKAPASEPSDPWAATESASPVGSLPA